MRSTKRDLVEEYGECERGGRRRRRERESERVREEDRERDFTSSLRRDTSLTRRAVYCRKELLIFFLHKKESLKYFLEDTMVQPFLPFSVPGLKTEPIVGDNSWKNFAIKFHNFGDPAFYLAAQKNTHREAQWFE